MSTSPQLRMTPKFHKSAYHPVIDFETKSRAKIKSVGAYRYAEDESTEILMMSYNISGKVGETKLWVQGDKPPMVLFALIKSGFRIMAHNRFFELCIWNSVGHKKYGWPRLPLESIVCSADVAKAVALPANLAGAGEAMGLSIVKDKEGKRLINKFCKPRRAKTGPEFNQPEDHPEDWKKFKGYCVTDTDTTIELICSLPKLPKFEQEIAFLTDRMNNRGIYIDIEAVKAAIDILGQIDKKYNSEAKRITGGFLDRVSQREKLVAWCALEGYPLPDVQALTITRALAKRNFLPPKVRRVLEIRQICGKTSGAKYKSMLERLCSDGYIHELLNYHRARTGRFGGMGVQIQNLPRPTLPKGTDYGEVVELIKTRDLAAIEAFHDNPMEVISSAIRSMICAPKGKELISADYAAIEARVLMWLAEDEKGLQIFRDGKDIYLDMAATIYNVAIESLNKESPERPLGKEAILGLGYQMGGKKFKTRIKDVAGIDISLEMAEKIVRAYRKKYRKIYKLWYGVEEVALKAVLTPGVVFTYKRIAFKKEGRFLICRLPSGKKLYYLDPEINTKQTDWGDKEGLTYMGQDSYTRKWCRLDTYGGKLVENITQAVARDLMAVGMLALEKEGYELNMSVHDELVAEIWKGSRSLEHFERVMATLPGWAKGCPVVAEGWIGPRYRK